MSKRACEDKTLQLSPQIVTQHCEAKLSKGLTKLSAKTLMGQSQALQCQKISLLDRAGNPDVNMCNDVALPNQRLDQYGVLCVQPVALPA